jgi:hypothetical protein
VPSYEAKRDIAARYGCTDTTAAAFAIGDTAAGSTTQDRRSHVHVLSMSRRFGMTMINALAATGNGGSQRHDHADEPALCKRAVAGQHRLIRVMGLQCALRTVRALLRACWPRSLVTCRILAVSHLQMIKV